MLRWGWVRVRQKKTAAGTAQKKTAKTKEEAGHLRL
jgi:hypothetical protein